MYNQEHKIAQAEFAAFNASFNKPAVEGATVMVPNLIDRLVATLKNALQVTGASAQPTPQDAVLGRGASAWRQVKTALEIGRDTAYLSRYAAAH